MKNEFYDRDGNVATPQVMQMIYISVILWIIMVGVLFYFAMIAIETLKV